MLEAELLEAASTAAELVADELTAALQAEPPTAALEAELQVLITGDADSAGGDADTAGRAEGGAAKPTLTTVDADAAGGDTRRAPRAAAWLLLFALLPAPQLTPLHRRVHPAAVPHCRRCYCQPPQRPPSCSCRDSSTSKCCRAAEPQRASEPHELPLPSRRERRRS